MKKALVLALALAAFSANAEDVYLGTIASSGASTTNAQTATAFDTSGYNDARLSIQCDAAAYVKLVKTSTSTVTSSNGVKLAADQLYDLDVFGKKWVAIIPVSGSANCRVYAYLKR